MPFESEAIEVLRQLQYTAQEAKSMVQKALAANNRVTTVEQLIELIFRTERQAQTG